MLERTKKSFIFSLKVFLVGELAHTNWIKSYFVQFRILFFSSWLLRQLAVRPPISIGMVRHVPLAPSVGQGTEWKPNVAKSKTQSVKNVGLGTIGRITRAWNRVFSKLSCTQYLRFWFIFEKWELIKLIDLFSLYILKALGEFPLWLFTNQWMK